MSQPKPQEIEVVIRPNNWVECLKEFDAELKRLRLALSFYADEENYCNDIQIDRGDGSYDYSTTILEDNGKTARLALGPKT